MSHADDASDLTYEVYKDPEGKYRGRLIAGNHRTIADSGEGYDRRVDCMLGIDLVRGSRSAKMNDLTK